MSGLSEKNHNKAILYGLVALFVLFGTNTPIAALIAFVIGAIAIVKMDAENSASLIFFLMPMATIFKLGPNEQSFFTYLELLYVVVYFLRCRGVVPIQFVPILFLTAYIVPTQMIGAQINVTRTIKFVSGFIYLMAVCQMDWRKVHRKIFLSFIVGVLLSSVYGLMDSTVFHINAYVGQQIQRITDNITINRFSGLYGDPNYYSVNLIIALCLTLVLYTKNEIKKTTAIVVSILSVMFVALTGSKSAMIMLIFPVIVFLYICAYRKNYILLLISIVMASGFFTALLMGRIEMFSNMLIRLKSATDLNLLTTGRSNEWIRYLNYLGEHPIKLLIGHGIATTVIGGKAPHNTYIDLLVQLGLIGTGLFIWMLSDLYRFNNDRKQKKIFLNFVVWISMAIMYFFLSELQYYDFPLHLALGYILMKVDFEDSLNFSGLKGENIYE